MLKARETKFKNLKKIIPAPKKRKEERKKGYPGQWKAVGFMPSRERWKVIAIFRAME